MRVIRIPALGLAMLLLTWVSPSIPDASAGTRSLADFDDAHGPLDIALIRHGHGSTEDTLLHRITTFSRWRDRALGTRGDMRLIFSTHGDKCGDRVISIGRKSGTWRALISDYDPVLCSGPHDDVGGGSLPIELDARIWRPDRRSIAISFDRDDLLGRRDDDYRWAAQTRWASENCRRGTCYDAAPSRAGGKRGILRHIL